MKYIIFLLVFAVPAVYADTVQFCQGQTTNSIFWQKSICSQNVTCEIFDPSVSTFQFSEFEYLLAISQTSGHCTDANLVLLEPVSYHIIITDEEFDYIVYDVIFDSLEMMPDIVMYVDIPYSVQVFTDWKIYQGNETFSEGSVKTTVDKTSVKNRLVGV